MVSKRARFDRDCLLFAGDWRERILRRPYYGFGFGFVECNNQADYCLFYFADKYIDFGFIHFNN